MSVLGTASNNTTVTLCSYSTTSRKGECFRGELYANNATGAVWLTITNVAVLAELWQASSRCWNRVGLRSN